MQKRSPLLEMLILEAKGFLSIDSKRVIEICCGWCEGTCDDDLEYVKCIEAYDDFLRLQNKYVMDNLFDFGIITLFERIKTRIDEGYDYIHAIVKMLQGRFFIMNIPLAEPPHEYLKQEYKDILKIDKNYLNMFQFSGKIEEDGLFLKIVE